MNIENDNNIVFAKIGSRIRQYRKRANLTQEKLSEKIGITPKHLSKFEAGRHNPHIDTIIWIAKE